MTLETHLISVGVVSHPNATMQLWFLAWVIALQTLVVSGADLLSIDRKLAREPAYQTRQPKYCLAVFGPKAEGLGYGW